MRLISIWTAAFPLVAGVSLAAPPVEAPIRDPQPAERPMLLEDSSWENLVLPGEEVVTAEEIVVARKKRGGGGKRGGANRKSRGGFREGNRRHAQRHVGEPGRLGDPGGLRGGEPGRPGRVGDPGGIRGGELGRPGRVGDVDIHGGDVDIDRRVNVRGGGGGWWGGGGGYYDDDDDDFGEAVAGGIVGMGIGKLLFDDDEGY